MDAERVNKRLDEIEKLQKSYSSVEGRLKRLQESISILKKELAKGLKVGNSKKSNKSVN